jgi:hypothetical protein
MHVSYREALRRLHTPLMTSTPIKLKSFGT